MEEHKFKTSRVLAILAGFLSAIAISMPGKIVVNKGFWEMLVNEIDNGVGFMSFMVFIATTAWYWNSWDFLVKRKHWAIHAISGLFSVFTLIGKSYIMIGSWGFIFYSKHQFAIAVLSFVGYFILYESCVCALFAFMDSKKVAFQNANAEQEGILQKIEKHYFTFAFIVISVCWLPWLIAFLPGSVPHDGYTQINMAFGVTPLSDNHPWIVTVVIGALMRAGINVSDNFGVFVVVFTFFVIEVICYALVCKKIKQWNAPRVFNLSVLIFFAVVPVFGAYAQTVIKDGIFTAFVALFMALYADFCLSCLNITPQGDMKRRMLVLLAVGFLVCITRTNGVYIVLPADLLLFFFLGKGERKYALLVTVALVASYYGIDNKLASSLGVEPGSVKEMLSIPLQQTARYFREFPDDVTQDELEAISAVMEVDGLAERYVPQISDPVKDKVHVQSEESLTAYLKAWSAMFCRHPHVYFEATLHNMYGYFYPFSNECTRSPYQFYIMGEPIAMGDFDIYYIMPEKVRNWMGSYAYAWLNMPGLSQLLTPGFYSWCLLLLCAYMVYCRQYKRLLLFAGPLLITVGCIASPVNALLRYSMPLIACMPVLICWCFIGSSKKDSNDCVANQFSYTE